MDERASARESLRRWVCTGVPPRPRTADAAAALAAEACLQGVASLLAAAGVPWPDPLPARLRALRLEALATGTRQLELAGRVQRSLLGAGVRVLPLKGAALADALYATPADRPMEDVDLLALDGWPSALRHLAAMGLREVDRADHARSFRDPRSGVVIELHHAPTSCPGVYPLDAEGLWARSRTVPGPLARTPAPADLLVLLALHAAFQHGLVLRLVQYWDFRRLLQSADLDAALVVEIAARARALPVLAAALAAAQAVVAAPVPPALLAALGTARPRALARVLDGASAVPLRLLPPAAPPLARARWALTPGRRLRLLRGTLSPREPGESAAPVRGLLRAARRTASLVWRHGAALARG
jgi:hypothetical protein